MYISYIAKSIANSRDLWYNRIMSIEYKHELDYRGVWFGHLKGSSFRRGNEIHPYHEIIWFLKARGKILCEQFEAELCDNSLLVIPANSYHQVMIDDQEGYTRLLMNFYGVDELTDTPTLGSGRIKYIDRLSEDAVFLLKKITDNIKCADQVKQKLVYGAFVMLLSEIEAAEGFSHSARGDAERELLGRCLAYIDENFGGKLSAANIARVVGISESSLYSLFKRNLGISLHRYITEKRIMYAHTKIKEGALPTKIYPECGYNDYATFYKAYVKLFGKAPSDS